MTERKARAKEKSNSRFPLGMTAKKAKAKTTADEADGAATSHPCRKVRVMDGARQHSYLMLRKS
jgi:hypothetical protein